MPGLVSYRGSFQSIDEHPRPFILESPLVGNPCNPVDKQSRWEVGGGGGGGVSGKTKKLTPNWSTYAQRI